MDNWFDLYSSPTNLLLLVFIAAFAAIMVRVQMRGDFDWAQVFQDDNDRVSAGRFMAMGAFISSTWVLMHTAVDKTMSDTFAIGYLAAWSGTMVASKAVDAYRDKGVFDVRIAGNAQSANLRSGAGGGISVSDRGVGVRPSLAVASGDFADREGAVGVGRERV